MTPSHPATLPRIALLACSVFEREIALYARDATHIVTTQFFEMGLHDRPDRMRAVLQEQLEVVDARADIDWVVLAYGLCGRGTVGLSPRQHRLVLPRAHDCVTVFLGSKEAYAQHQCACPSCYYYTPGWNRGRRVPGPERLEALRTELGRKFDADDVEYLLASEKEQWARHDTVTYLDLGTDDAESEADYARRCATWLGWQFERRQGDPSLLRDLLWANWDDDRFQVIAPGRQLGHAPDDRVMRSEPKEIHANIADAQRTR